jgi:bla regulator protein BlaR1
MEGALSGFKICYFFNHNRRQYMRTKTAILCLMLITISIFGCGQKRIVDNINLPFVTDPAVIGEWASVDFVKEPSLFTPDSKSFKEDFYLKGLSFLPEGKMLVDNKTVAPWFTWTKGVVMHSGDKTASAYTVKDIGGMKYMFLEWKSGDYFIRHQKPYYYVLEKNNLGMPKRLGPRQETEKLHSWNAGEYRAQAE